MNKMDEIDSALKMPDGLQKFFDFLTASPDFPRCDLCSGEVINGICIDCYNEYKTKEGKNAGNYSF